MKTIRYLFVCLTWLTSSLYAQENKPIVLDKVIAVVGDNIVKRSELESQYVQYVQLSEDVDEQTKCDILEELLYNKLLIAQAKRDSVDVTEGQVDGELERRLRYYISQFGSEEKFESFYGKTIDEFKIDLRDDVKDLLLAESMQSKITGGVAVTPADVKAYFEEIPKDSLPFINAEVEVGQLIIKPPISDEAKVEARKKIEKLRDRVLKGERFSSLAVLYSEDPGSAKNGGEYKNIQRGQFVPEFDAISFSLKENEISEVFETSYGYHFMQLIKRKGEFVDIRHILISPKVSDSDLMKAKTKLDSVHQLILIDSLSFEEAAARYSDDEETKNSGGLMLNPLTGNTRFEMDQLGQLDPSLVFTLNKLKVGEMSKPALSLTKDAKQAFRILYLKNRTQPHQANLKDDYQKIQAAALEEKKQEVISKWVKRTLKGTYVSLDEDYNDCKFENNWFKNNN